MHSSKKSFLPLRSGRMNMPTHHTPSFALGQRFCWKEARSSPDATLRTLLMGLPIARSARRSSRPSRSWVRSE